MKILYGLLMVISLTGCASNGFKKFYNSNVDDEHVANIRADAPGDAPKLVSGINIDTDPKMMLEKGYVLIGYSSFFGPGNNSSDDALSQGKKVHADAVIYYMGHKDTVSAAMPMTTSSRTDSTANINASSYGSGGYRSVSGTGYGTSTTRGTQYVPYSVDRFNYFASYWVKRKPPIFGAGLGHLSSEQRSKIKSNKGVVVGYLVKDTPAYNSDILEGDIIRKVNDSDVSDPEGLLRLLEESAGKTIDIEIIRDSQTIHKSVKLNEKAT